MPHGKPAGVRCVQLTDDNHCKLFGLPERSAVCASLMPAPEMCGATAEEATAYLLRLESLTAPERGFIPHADGGCLPVHE